VDEDSDVHGVTVPVRVVVRRSELHGTAMFDIRDGRISAFEVVTRS
jgi:hypothetical protein